MAMPTNDTEWKQWYEQHDRDKKAWSETLCRLREIIKHPADGTCMEVIIRRLVNERNELAYELSRVHEELNTTRRREAWREAGELKIKVETAEANAEHLKNLLDKRCQEIMKSVVPVDENSMTVGELIAALRAPEQDLSRQRELTRQAYENGFEEGLAYFPHRNTMSIDLRASCQEILDECGGDVNENDLIQFIRYFTTHAVAIFENDDGERIEMRPQLFENPE